ncbi:MAG: hypothetical protein HYX87_08305 [Chloroflexi bacterium]|nr:hypothetical protein [Chloroflexota bacterium]
MQREPWSKKPQTTTLVPSGLRRVLRTWAIMAVIMSMLLPAGIARPTLGATKGYATLTTSLSLEEGGGGYTIPRGSMVTHTRSGITTVLGPDRRTLLEVRDADARFVKTPNGPVRSTHVFQVPTGSMIATSGNTTSVFVGNNLVLTVVNGDTGGNHQPPPAVSGWMEYTQARVPEISSFHARWQVPASPPDNGYWTYNYIFNAIESSDGTDIIQPVLEFNVDHDKKWTLAAWKGADGNYFRATPVEANVGDEIWGKMSWYPIWHVEAQNRTTGKSSTLSTNAIPGTNLYLFTGLEGYYIEGNKDVPGDIDFTNMVFNDIEGRPLDIVWSPFISDHYVLALTSPSVDKYPKTPTGMGINILSPGHVQLLTAN